MGAGTSSRAMAVTQEFVKQLIAADKVVIFSKTYCPYCTMAKEVNLFC